MAKANPFRFSTKYDDDESDLLYYGYRYYKPSTGTWPSRDPLEEWGGVNLYSIAGNNFVNDVDYDGRQIFVPPIIIGIPNTPLCPEGAIEFDGDAGWGLAQLVADAGNGTFGQVTQFTAKWEAKVTVYCGCCGKKNGRRVASTDLDGGPWIIYKPTNLPMGLPLGKSVANVLGKILAYPIKEVLGNLYEGWMDDDQTARLMGKISGARPTDPYAGEWKGGESPCNAR